MTNEGANKDFKTALDSVANEILQLPHEEVLNLYREANINPDEGPNRIKNLLSEKLNMLRRQRIREARQISEDTNRKKRKTFAIPETFEEQRTLLERLLSLPNIPKLSTVSFRDGKGVPDADLKSILEDLSDLGIQEDEK